MRSCKPPADQSSPQQVHNASASSQDSPLGMGVWLESEIAEPEQDLEKCNELPELSQLISKVSELKEKLYST